jgi:hypothetical protein
MLGHRWQRENPGRLSKSAGSAAIVEDNQIKEDLPITGRRIRRSPKVGPSALKDGGHHPVMPEETFTTRRLLAPSSKVRIF